MSQRFNLWVLRHGRQVSCGDLVPIGAEKRRLMQPMSTNIEYCRFTFMPALIEDSSRSKEALRVGPQVILIGAIAKDLQQLILRHYCSPHKHLKLLPSVFIRDQQGWQLCFTHPASFHLSTGQSV